MPTAVSVRPTFVLIGLVAFVTTLDGNIIAAAAPSIGSALRLDLTGLQWLSLSYLLPFASLLLLAGALIDRWGSRRSLLAGLLLFGLAAIVAGLARSLPVLLLARAGQGCAAAVVLPGTLSLLRTNLDGRQRTLAAATWTAALAGALAAGPLLGGALSQYLGWSWIFYLNVPFTLAAAALTMRCTATRALLPPAPLDVVGVTAITLAGLTLVLALAGAPRWHGVDLTVPLLLASVAGLIAFVAVQRRTANPTVPPALIRQRMVAAGLTATLLWGLGITGIVFFTPLLDQRFLGLDAAEAGLPLLIVAGAIVVATPLVGRIVGLTGERITVSVGLAVVAAGLVALASVDSTPTMAPRVPGLILIGLGSAFTTPLTSSILDAAPTNYAGTASGLVTASRELASAVGVALVGAVLTWQRNAALAHGTAAAPALAAGYTAGLLLAATLQGIAAALVFCYFPSRRATKAG